MMDLGRVGIWSSELRTDTTADAGAAAAAVEEMGYGTLWIPGGAGGPILERVEEALATTSRIVVATGILNVWGHEPDEVRAGWTRIEERHPGRFMLAIGIGHRRLVDQDAPGRYRKPLETMTRFLDGLDAGTDPVPPDRRMIAALGPTMLELARERTAGSHSYFVPTAHTAMARAALGPDLLLAPELSVTLQSDREADLRAAHEFMELYLTLQNYTNTLRRLGFDEPDLSGQGSERLADAVVAGGGLEGIKRAVAAHHHAGADHVCLQVVPRTSDEPPLAAWRELAAATLAA